MDKKHGLVSKLKELASELGRTPKRDEFDQIVTEHQVRKEFGTYTALLHAAGFKGRELAKEHKNQKFKYQKSQIESFFVHEVDLAEIFKKAGNPSVIRMLAIPDVHVKNRDVKAVETLLEFAEWYCPHVVLLYGDFLDCEDLSHWEPKDTAPREFIPEVLEARELLEEINRRTPKAVYRVYLKGNHEDWIDQAFAAKLPAFFHGLEQIGLMPDLKALLDLDRLNYDLIPLNHFLKIGKSHHTHGLFTGPNHPAKHLALVKGNIYYGHMHDMKETHEPTINGIIEAASCGHLSRNDAKFLKGRPNNWQHGFNTFEFFTDGSYSRFAIKIFNGRFSFNGKIFGS